MTRNHLFRYAISFSLVFWGSASLARAVDINPSIPGSPDNASTPGGIVANFYQFALMLGGLLAFGVIIYGALEYTIAVGNPTKQHDARDRITQALIGLLLLAGIYFILNIINPNLTKLQLAPLPTVEAPAQSGPLNSGVCVPSCTGTNVCMKDGAGNPRCVTPPAQSGCDPSKNFPQNGCPPAMPTCSLNFQTNTSSCH